MTHRRYQLGCALTACVLAVFGLWCARQGQWVPTAALGYGCLFFAYLARRERRASACPPAALNAPSASADPNNPENGPCCPVSARFGANSHDTHCPRTGRAA